MSTSQIPARGVVALPGRVLDTAETLFGGIAVSLFAAIQVVVHWVTTFNGWIFFFLVTKPLVDLSWRSEFANVFNQRVNPQALLAILVAILNGIAFLFSRRRPRHSGRVLLFLGFAILSVIITPTAGGVNELVRLICGISFFFTAGLVLADRKKFDRFSIALLALICVPLILSIFQMGGLLPFDYWDEQDGLSVGRATGTYQHPTELVSFLVYAVPLALYRWEDVEKSTLERIFLGLFFFLAILGLGFTFLRAGWVAICAEVVVWYASRKRLRILIPGVVALLVLGFVFSGWLSMFYQPMTEIFSGQADFASGDFLRGRGANWIAFLVSYENGGPIGWLIGRGGSLAQVYVPGLLRYEENEPHNDFIRILHAYGLVGLFLYFSLLVTFFRAGLRSQNSVSRFVRGVGRILICALAGILLLSITTEPMRYPTAVWYLFALASALFTLEARTKLSRMEKLES